MKKLLNRPDAYADEALAGLCAAHPDIYRQLGETGRVIARAGGMREGKVGIVSGGGSGHMPTFTGYVGEGLLDACSVGNVFAGPSVLDCMEAVKAANGGRGVLLLYGNYGGDKMNFNMAAEMLEMEGIPTKTVLVADDVGSAQRSEREKRRGVAGLIYPYKIAGAKAEQNDASLSDVAAIARKAVDATVSIGVALTPCTVPEAGKPTFSIDEGEMEIGMGIHGEPGIVRGPLKSADAVADDMLERLLADADIGAGERVSVLVNSLGATPLEELYILYARIEKRLKERDISIVMPRVGRYATSMEMAGASLSLCRLDSELEALLAAPAVCPFWSAV
ncbi:dihydroxyacetone kinase subunit DhaK [Burkholderia multivorans]|uniref:Kinase n=1 Tax=Caballeronia ptereochthonis TaxID=1777144 RepID=A0A157ZTY3_9BURK|nr:MULTISPECIES: dihydroxyacetone kinase subunit DhaK [Burkholderiaceae]KVS18931.1 dihydroxyacetone kinase [Burkholderia multivorans]MBU9652504.1 dihydroxyacetone kinase subunit DhaK [Burkholderia multivorans]MCL4664799.1 dihydroxyacetone kinase subunit DhaK [Burkholderia multivorans]MCO1356546.1 dihydroxyacetone kinase subunit DhaK [Burkholderia multivorans]MCO1415250.1 dihydroxyacetone kinase subunit DhaK [Burkholderia multivorans]